MKASIAWLAGGVLSLILLDSALRVIEATPLWRVLPVVEPILGQPDKAFGFDFTPGASGVWPREHRARVRIDTLGLRDIERTVEKPPGRFRIGLLGDSMTEALQVSQQATFGAIAERELRAQGNNVEVINLAMAGLNPIRQLLRLEGHGYALGLDVVVANSPAESFAAGVLLDDSDNPGYVPGPGGGLVRGYGFRSRLSQRYADTFVGRAFVALYQHSPLFRMLYLRGKQPPWALLGLASAEQPRAGPPDSCEAATAALARHLALWRDHQPARYWQATARFLDDFAADTRARGILVLYAMRGIVLPPADCAAAAPSRAELVAVMSGEFAARGMQFVDWSAAVADIAGPDLGRLRGFGRNRGAGHLNYEGHRAWAAALIKVLDLRPPGRAVAG